MQLNNFSRPYDARQARAATRLVSEYTLRFSQALSKYHGGDIQLSVVFRAILAANTRHLNETAADECRYSSIDTPIPDESRRPVSVLEVSGMLQLPYETTRRYANRLLDLGHCKRIEGGLIVPGSVLEGDDVVETMLAEVANLRRLLWELKSAGVTLDD